MSATVDMELCTGCGTCAEACPVIAISVLNGKARVDAEKCVRCGICEGECPRKAILVE